jgi:polysaccharide pyruvyl transferase WcaK-like protein
MRILHTYCLNYNIGDYALGIGLKNLLKKYLDVNQIGNTNIQGREFNEYYIKEVVNKRYDLLVIGGGGIIHGAHWPNGWFWLIDQELIQKIEIPFIVYGAGNNYWIEEGGIPDKAVKHLKETISRAAYFSVRNDGSANRLETQLGISNISAVPDPGFHVDISGEYKRVIDEPYVLIQLANDKPQIRFGSLEEREDFIKRMRIVTKDLARKYRVIFSPHVLDDVSLSKQISSGIENTEVWDFGYFAFDHSDEAIDYYKYANFVLSMRGHGQIIPICFNTPVISIENHPKHRGLMEELGLMNYNVRISSAEFLESMKATIAQIEGNRTGLVKEYRKINIRLRDESERAFNVIKKNLKF